MISFEPGRSSAYSEDLRWRMVWQSEAVGLSRRAIANNLGVNASTVSRTLAPFQATGSVAKHSYPKDEATRKLLSLVSY